MRHTAPTLTCWLNILLIISLLGQSMLPMVALASVETTATDASQTRTNIISTNALSALTLDSRQDLLAIPDEEYIQHISANGYLGAYFSDSFVPSYSELWEFTGTQELITPGRTDSQALKLPEGASAEIRLIVPTYSELRLSYWCRDEVEQPGSDSRHELYLDGEDTTPWASNDITCAANWVYKELLIDKKYTADGQVTIKFHVANLSVRSPQVGFDDVLVQGTILPTDQAYSPNECPICSNAETRHYVGGPIDTYSGNYNYETTDLSIPTLGMPLQFERTYNSHTITDTATGVYTRPLGYGWTHSYNIDLIFPDELGGEEDTLILKAAHGSRLRFEAHSDGSYTPYPGIQAQLSHVGQTYIITTANQTVYTFGSSEGAPSKPRLLTMRDPQGNETSFSYNNDRLHQVAGPTGLRWLEFSYDEQGRLTQVSDHSERTLDYAYDTQDRLTVMTDTRELAWTYEYSGTSSLLHAIIDPDGRAVERTYYNEASQAIKQENGAGEAIVEIAYPDPFTRIVSEFGRVLTDTYDVRGLLISQIDAEGNEQAYGLDGNFNRTEVQDGNQNTTTFARNEFGYTTALTDALDHTTIFTYNTQNKLTAMQDARGYVTHYTYDNNNNLRSVETPLADTAVFTYNTQGQVTAAQNENEHLTRFAYDDFGNTIAITDALKNVTHFEYDNLGRLLTTINALGHITLSEYDAGDNLIRVTENYTPAHPPNHLQQYNLITQYAYDGANRPTFITDTRSTSSGQALNRVTKYDYDPAGRLSQTTENYLPGQPQNYQNEYNLITHYDYDQSGRLTLVTDTAGRQTRSIYNARNLLEETHIYDSANPTEALITRYEYDAAGNLVNVIDPLERITHSKYDALNRIEYLIQNYQPGSTALDANLTTRYQYDPVGNLAYVTNPLNQVTAYQHDPLNRLSKVIEYHLTGTYSGIPDQDVTTRYGYDAVGNRTVITDANGYASTFTFDALNRPTARQDPLSHKTAYAYDALGNQTVITDANGLPTHFDYDALNQLHHIDYANSTPDVTFDYDARGNVLTMTDGLTSPVTYRYDSLDRLTQINDNFSQTITYTYDSLSRRTHLTFPEPVEGNASKRTLTYTYDFADRLTKLTDWDGGQYGYTYNAASQLSNLTYPNGLKTVYDYDGAGRLITLTHQHGFRTVARYGYKLDALGNRLQAVESLLKPSTPLTATPLAGPYFIYLPLVVKSGLLPSRTIDYTYDNLNRLTLADYDSGETFAYGYDPVGNRLTQTINSALTSYAYDEANRLTNVNGVAYEWDDNGNLLSDGTRTFTYDAADRLTQVVSGSLDSQFEYNGLGDRTRQWVNGEETHYLLDPVGLTQVLAETTGGQTTHYLPGLAQYSHNAWQYQLPDPLGSVRQLLDAQNKILLAQSYDPFGNLIQRSAVGSQRSSFGYTGQQVDSTGLVYLRARYYDSLTGRFISKDPFSGFDDLSQTQNAYVYGLNNPIRYTDPSGRCAEPVSGTACLLGATKIAIEATLLLGAIYFSYELNNQLDHQLPPFPSTPPRYDGSPPFDLGPCPDPAYIPGPTLGNIAPHVFDYPLSTERNIGTTSYPETRNLQIPTIHFYEKGEDIELGRFTERRRGGILRDPKTGEELRPDRARNSGAGSHGGSYWKLYNRKGKRIGTISQDGRWLRQ